MNVSGSNDDRQLPVSTWHLLRSLGFVEDQAVMSEPPGGLSLDFGNFKLAASHGINRWFQPVVLLSGTMSTPRMIGEVACEMPREVDSWEQGVAWVTWCLDNHADRMFKPASPVVWLGVGRQYRHLLPWERERAMYDARPRCQVQRDWAQVGLRTLAEHVATVDDAPVVVQFDGEVLTIRCAGKVIAMPASGEAWTSRYSLTTEVLRRLPKRLMREVVEFSVWDSVLTIGNRGYGGVVTLDAEKHK